MRAYIDQILPHSEPVLVDLRRGEVHRVNQIGTDPASVDRWLAGEAVGFAAMWRAA